MGCLNGGKRAGGEGGWGKERGIFRGLGIHDDGWIEYEKEEAIVIVMGWWLNFGMWSENGRYEVPVKNRLI